MATPSLWLWRRNRTSLSCIHPHTHISKLGHIYKSKRIYKLTSWDLYWNFTQHWWFPTRRHQSNREQLAVIRGKRNNLTNLLTTKLELQSQLYIYRQFWFDGSPVIFSPRQNHPQFGKNIIRAFLPWPTGAGLNGSWRGLATLLPPPSLSQPPLP